jgi:ABC-2 type transport system ATP-binding protein
MIKVVDLTKEFGRFTAVDRVSFNVAAGEVLALLGPNGAGKTTTVRVLGAILPPSQGYARIAGYDATQQAQTVRGLIGLLTEFGGLYPRMTGLDYLHFFGGLQGLSAEVIRRRSRELLERFELAGAGHRPVGAYSKGMKQKLALIRAMLHHPPVLFLDEPTSALDPHSAKLVREVIAELRREKWAIVLCTHNLIEAEQLADRIAIMQRGRLIAQGTVLELRQQLGGEALIELRLAEPLNGLRANLAARVNIVACGQGITFALRIGATLVAPPTGLSLGQALLLSTANFVKILIFLVIPLLLLAAFIEANITPKLS